MKNKNNLRTYIWACEFNNHSGEGKLSNLFYKNILIKKNLKNFTIETPLGIITKKNIKKLNNFSKLKSNIYTKYVTPFEGLLKVYINKYVFKKRTVYLNYLPIWNFVLFLLLPKKTILGPITGSDFHNFKGIVGILRSLLLIILSSISKLIINIKYSELFFSTNLIEFSNVKHNNLFQLKYSLNKKKRKKIKKDLDLIFYFRNHPTKYSDYEIDFIKKLIKSGKKVKIVGDLVPDLHSHCLGYLNQNKLTRLLDRSKYTISSLENPFSFFVQDAILIIR